MTVVISTYSIVACDLVEREWGIAVQSKFLAVGAMVPYAEAEVGAVATQALANLSYGSRGLDLLRAGSSAQEAIETITAADPERDHRQVGVVDARGRAATYTGSACLDWAGGLTGRCYAAQGNILVSSATVDALAEAFESSEGRPLAERLLGCLGAAQEAGGDRRGQQSAALLVVRRGGGYGGTSDRVVDLRVDEHTAPVAELERIFEIHQRLFGSTDEQDWVTVDDALLAEIAARLRALGYDEENVADAFTAWTVTENLEERARGLDMVDPVVLDTLRAGP